MDVNLRSIAFINGVAICALGAVMAIPLIFDIFFCCGKCISIFIPSILSCLFLGISTIISFKENKEFNINRRDTFLIVSSLWVIISIFSAIPFYVYSGIKLSFISAFFEAVSGITTTGASIYQDVEILPRALNLWRFILHFIGGVGIVAIGIVALPIMRIGGMQLFINENSDKSKKFFPRVSQIAGFFIGAYVVVVSIFTISLKLCGMSLFDSVCHSISAISTGGFSTKNSGINWYNSDKIKIILSIAMFIGGIAFLEIIRCVKSGFKSFFKNQQILGYFKIVFLAIFIPIILSIISGNKDISSKNICSYIYQVISAISTTEFDSSDSFLHPKFLLLILGMLGGCSGSTSGGIKIFRIQILYAILKYHISQLSSVFNINSPKYHGSKINENLSVSIISFFALLIITFIVSVTLISITSKQEISKCFHCVISCLFNLGYDVNFLSFPFISKLILIVDMIVGRLEIVPLFIIFSRSFWK